MLKQTLLSLITAGVLQGAACARPVDEPEVQESIAARIDAIFTEREKEGFGGVLLVAQGGVIVLERAYGMRDKERETPMRKDDVFDIGSIVKPITAAAIYRLESEGKLRSDDPLSRWFSDVPDDKAAITIDQLLAHTAGFPDTFGGDYDLIGREDLRKRMFESPLVASPGEREAYSNSGYSLLAMIIEDASGLPYEEYVHESFFRPVGGAERVAGEAGEAREARGAGGAGVRIGYALPDWRRDELAVNRRGDRRFGTPLEHSWYGDGPSWHLRGNGGMLASARDLYELFMALEGDPGVLDEPARERWMKALTIRHNGVRVYGIFGGSPYFNAMILRNLDADLMVIGMSNDGVQRVEDSVDELAKIVTE